MTRQRPSSAISHQSSRLVFSWPVRVYYEDTDFGGVVYYANYLKFMERARTEWLRSLGFAQTGLAADHGVMFVVRSIALKYLKPARMDDPLEVSVELAVAGASHIGLVQRVQRGEECLVTATVDIACVQTDTFKPARIPAPITEKIEK
jgi:acyl-CoA thioester hydrolase